MNGGRGEQSEEPASEGGILGEDGLVGEEVDVVGYVLVAVGRGDHARLGRGGGGGGG